VNNDLRIADYDDELVVVANGEQFNFADGKLDGASLRDVLAVLGIQAEHNRIEDITQADFDSIVDDGISNYMDAQGGTPEKLEPIVRAQLAPQYCIVEAK
jgi:hypothetical protein